MYIYILINRRPVAIFSEEANEAFECCRDYSYALQTCFLYYMVDERTESYWWCEKAGQFMADIDMILQQYYRKMYKDPWLDVADYFDGNPVELAILIRALQSSEVRKWMPRNELYILDHFVAELKAYIKRMD